MRRVVMVVAGFALVLAAVVAASDDSSPAPTFAAVDGPRTWYLQANIAGGRADGAEERGTDDVVAALADQITGLEVAPRAVFLNEACESHGAQLAHRLGPEWRAFFVQAWPGMSFCFPAPGQTLGRYGNVVLVADPDAVPVSIPSCNDPDSALALCLPNWAPPAEQRNGSCAETGGDLLCSVHLDPGSWQWHDEQLRTIGRIAGSLVSSYRTVVIGGDLNDGRRDVRRAFPDTFVDVAGPTPHLTYPASHPRREIDHVLVGDAAGAVRSGGARVVDLGRCAATLFEDGRCSDHDALLVAVVER
jgi:endonuclease/exonuclease/phosphatase family metal-dependent hydrolase